MFDYSKYIVIATPNREIIHRMKADDKYIGIVTVKDKKWVWISAKEACELGILKEDNTKYRIRGYEFNYDESDGSDIEPNVYTFSDDFDKDYYRLKMIGNRKVNYINPYNKVCAFMNDGDSVDIFYSEINALCEKYGLESKQDKRIWSEILGYKIINEDKITVTFKRGDSLIDDKTIKSKANTIGLDAYKYLVNNEVIEKYIKYRNWYPCDLVVSDDAIMCTIKRYI